jgi:Zn-finger nucleic acid-binding protein
MRKRLDANESGSEREEISFELKYCERCGGLWLRPRGGEQIYCVTCARAMNELPPSSTEVKKQRAGRKKRSEPEFETYGIGEIELDEIGGVA